MAFDFGYLIAGGVFFYIIATMYKKKTGQNISELWKNQKEKIKEIESPGYQRIHITKGIKQ